MSKEAVATETKTEVKFPDRFNVILINDDHTPMDFVIKLLVEIFNKGIKDAKELTMKVHNEGQAIAGSYNNEIANQKHHEAVEMAKGFGYPLQIKLEKM